MIDDSTRRRKLHMSGSIMVLGVFVALSLTAVGVARHPESVQGTGKMLLQIEIALLLAYGLAGEWCAMVGMLTLLCVVFSANLVFERNAELQMSEAFASSGLSDPGVFLVRNRLEAALEGLVRMPILALVLSFIWAVANTWMSKASRRTLLLAACLAPFVFVAGAAALWHADSLERAARPPFVMSGVALAGLALCVAHPIWSSWHRAGGMASDAAISSSARTLRN